MEKTRNEFRNAPVSLPYACVCDTEKVRHRHGKTRKNIISYLFRHGVSSDTESHVHEGLLQCCHLGLQTCYQGSKAPNLREYSPVQLSQATHPANVVLQDSPQLFVPELGPRRRHR